MTNARVSSRVAGLQGSPIREILAVIDRPGMVSFAGGLPAADTFPMFSLDEMPPAMLQYGPSEGEPLLRERLALDLQAMGLDVRPDQVLILSGSQQGIDLVAKLFVDAGTRVALETPSYLAALQVFRFLGMTPIALDPDAPERALGPAGGSPPLAYVIPTFQNPTGACWTASQRERLAAVADDNHTVVFEDDPYRDLVYDRVERTPVCAHLRRSSWIYQGSFSKSLAPGLRLGYLAASPDLMPWLVRLKQAADLHSSRVSQWLVLQQLDQADRPARLAALADRYRGQRDRFQSGLLEYFSELATWQVPAGGLFFWLRLERPIDTSALLASAIERQVAFMPGEPFFAGSSQRYPAIRLNFSHASDADARRGLATLSALIRAHDSGSRAPH